MEFTKEEEEYIHKIIAKKRQEEEFHNKMCEGLMQYYKSDDWRNHIKRFYEQEAQNKMINTPKKKWWQKLF